MEAIFGLTLKLFALMTPTAVLGYFISHTADIEWRLRLSMAFKTGMAIFVIGETLFLSGAKIFDLFGFTPEAFGIGVGILLFLSAIRLMNEDEEIPLRPNAVDISVVPLAIPLGMGPASIGWIMVLGSDSQGINDILLGTGALLLSSFSIFAMLCLSAQIRALLGRTGITIMAKLTALLLSAVAAQVIFSGIRSFMAH